MKCSRLGLFSLIRSSAYFVETRRSASVPLYTIRSNTVLDQWCRPNDTRRFVLLKYHMPFLSLRSPKVVVQHSPSLSVGQLVCVTQYYPAVNGALQIGPALAVGRMALTSDRIGRSEKGKAVNIVHVWKDHLWEMGGREDPPAPRVIELSQKTDSEVGDGSRSGDPDAPAETTSGSTGEGSSPPQDEPPATPPKEEMNPLSQQGTSLGFLGNRFLTGKI